MINCLLYSLSVTYEQGSGGNMRIHHNIRSSKFIKLDDNENCGSGQFASNNLCKLEWSIVYFIHAYLH